jgi:DNA phosphorothioation-associated putative methyltransferase
LLVFLSLNLFERRRSLGHLSESLRKDVKAFFGSYANATTEAQQLLFATGKPAAIEEACRRAGDLSLGYLDADHSLQFHSSVTQQLPAILRVYIGCASRLYGDVDNADLVKVHIRSGKLSLMILCGPRG